jgi:hypothetical protein
VNHPAALAALAVQEVAKVLAKLTEEQLTDLVEGRAQVEFRSGEVVIGSGRARAPRKAAPKREVTFDVDEVVKTISDMTSPEEVIEYLEGRDKELTSPDLKEIARALGPTVSATGTKAELRRKIAQGTAGFRQRSAAVTDGIWGR